MIVKVTQTESDLIEKQCAIWELDFRKYTIENNPLLVQIEVRIEGREITPETAFHLCCVVNTQYRIKTL